MNTSDVIVILIAVYGAALSTILGIREFTKDRRHIKVVLEHHLFSNVICLRIVNTGHRPVSISNVSFSCKLLVSKNPRKFIESPVPAASVFDSSSSPDFPLLFNDGQMQTFQLSEVLSEDIINSGWRVRLTVTDGDGNNYHKFEKRIFNEKWGWELKDK